MSLLLSPSRKQSHPSILPTGRSCHRVLSRPEIQNKPLTLDPFPTGLGPLITSQTKNTLGSNQKTCPSLSCSFETLGQSSRCASSHVPVDQLPEPCPQILVRIQILSPLSSGSSMFQSPDETSTCSTIEFCRAPEPVIHAMHPDRPRSHPIARAQGSPQIETRSSSLPSWNQK
jgi:hypothetical protein